MRCPAGQTRYGDGSACQGGGLPNCDLGYCHNNPNGGMDSCVQPSSSSTSTSSSALIVDDDVSTFFASGGSGAGPESGCTYSADPCVCLSRCPAGQTRYGDGSACRGGGLPNCDLGYCHNNPNGGMDSCVQPTPWFRVDLGLAFNVHSVIVTSAAQFDVNSFNVYVGSNPSQPDGTGNIKCGSAFSSSMTLAAGSSISVGCGHEGRYVRLEKSRKKRKKKKNVFVVQSQMFTDISFS